MATLVNFTCKSFITCKQTTSPRYYLCRLVMHKRPTLKNARLFIKIYSSKGHGANTKFRASVPTSQLSSITRRCCNLLNHKLYRLVFCQFMYFHLFHGKQLRSKVSVVVWVILHRNMRCFQITQFTISHFWRLQICNAQLAAEHDSASCQFCI